MRAILPLPAFKNFLAGRNKDAFSARKKRAEKWCEKWGKLYGPPTFADLRGEAGRRLIEASRTPTRVPDHRERE